MSADDDNPFVRFGLDPGATLVELTALLRERMQDAETPEERAALRIAWEGLSRSPARRFELALEAGPAPEALPPQPEDPLDADVEFEPTLADLLAPLPLAPQLPSETEAERRLRRVDLRFLVRADEAATTLAITPLRRVR